MRRTAVVTLAVLLCVLVAGTALGHFHTYWPDSPNGYGRLDEQLSYQYYWGHPYENIVFDAPEPGLYAVSPDGQKAAIEPEPVEMEDPETGKARRAFTFDYTPQALGDTWVVLEAPAILIEEEGEAVQDYAKQCVHVMVEQGWAEPVGLPIEVVPLTRPYGLEEGFAVTARVLLDGKPLPDAHVEIEKLNGFHVTGETLPTDQWGAEDVPMITRAARTDADGYVTYTLDEPGWWVICATAEEGTVSIEGKEYPRVLRGCLWLHVEEEFTIGE
ncbi:MAG: DUF4198 domain-containing protein [Candidatus Brocadiia bacterium]